MSDLDSMKDGYEPIPDCIYFHDMGDCTALCSKFGFGDPDTCIGFCNCSEYEPKETEGVTGVKAENFQDRMDMIDCIYLHDRKNCNFYGGFCSGNENCSARVIKIVDAVISHPSHYVEGRKYEPKDVIRDWNLNFNLGNAIKYVARAGRKDDILQDLMKARQYLDFEIEYLEKEREVNG